MTALAVASRLTDDPDVTAASSTDRVIRVSTAQGGDAPGIPAEPDS